MTKLVRYGVLMCIAVVLGLFVSIQKDDASRRHAILLDFNTDTASADIGTSDSGSGSGDSGSGSGSGSGDSGSGDCGY